MTGEARVVALDRLWPGDIADCSGELLDVVFGWADFARLRRQVAAQCAAAGLTGTRLDDFVLAVHEIAANAIVHAGAGARLILRRAATGLRCLVADTIPKATASCPAPRSADMRETAAAAVAEAGRARRADRRRQRPRAVAGGHARRRAEHHLGTG